MKTEIDTAAGLRCQKCTNLYDRPEGGGVGMSPHAAARAIGWMVWEGRTIGGRDEHRVFCPRCAGRTEEPDPDAPSWDAMCRTCDAQATEEWDDEGPLSEDDVDRWKVDHRCEPDVQLVRPKSPGGVR